jgi:hypothetical protein
MISKRASRAGLKELEIFDNFEIDYNLPKHKNKTANINGINIIQASSNGFVSIGGSSIWVTPDRDGNTSISYDKKENFSFFKKIRDKIQKRFTVLQFFVGLSKNISDLKVTVETAKYYEKAIIIAKENGQTALVQKLNDLIFICKSKANLVDLKFTKYVTEQQVCKFYEKLPDEKSKYLQLSYLKNFIRLILSEVLEIKKKLDEKEIFDNYVILHYDPQTVSSDLTKEEKAAKKDPILFGVIEKSRKLYYIADWKDEVCDLTLDQMFSTLKETVFEINSNTVKSFINTGGVDILNEKQNKRKQIVKKSKSL